jgi:hypothetical protein
MFPAIPIPITREVYELHCFVDYIKVWKGFNQDNLESYLGISGPVSVLPTRDNLP